MDSRLAIGLMPATRATGIEAALVRIAGRGLDVRFHAPAWLSHPYPPELRAEVLALRHGGARLDSLRKLDQRLGEIAAEAAAAVAQAGGVALESVTAIGYHAEAVSTEAQGSAAGVFEVGEPAVIAERTGVTTVGRFRSRDSAAGGRGAPLVPLADWLLLHDPVKTRLAVHFGGLVKLSYLRAGCRPDEIIAFDVGPCGVLLDALARHLTGGQHEFDPGGRFAVQGVRLNALLRRWTSHPFFARRPPRSAGGEEFGDRFLRESFEAAVRQGWAVRDMLCTATHFVAAGLADAVQRHLPARPPIDELWASGGGVKNGFLLRLVQEQFAGIPVSSTEKIGVHPQIKRAATLATLAILTLDGVAGNLPAITGAEGPRLLGALTPGSAANWSRAVDYMAHPERQVA